MHGFENLPAVDDKLAGIETDEIGKLERPHWVRGTVPAMLLAPSPRWPVAITRKFGRRVVWRSGHESGFHFIAVSMSSFEASPRS